MSSVSKMKICPMSCALACLLLSGSTLFHPVSCDTAQSRSPILPLPGLGGLGVDYEVECSTEPPWTSRRIPSTRDCEAAVAKVKKRYDVFGTYEFEFFAPDIRPRSKWYSQKTPQRFQAGSCEVAVAMAETFDPRMLPGQVPGRHPSDIATWEMIFNGYVLSELFHSSHASSAIAESTQNHDLLSPRSCIRFVVSALFPSKWSTKLQKKFSAEAIKSWCTDKRQYGWYPIGKHGSIGIFMWEVGSDMDKILSISSALPSNTTTSKSLLNEEQ